MLDKEGYVQIEVGENITCAQFGTVKIYCGRKGWSEISNSLMLYQKDYLKRPAWVLQQIIRREPS